jgi:hypothetical protein
MGREIESREGIGWRVFKKKNVGMFFASELKYSRFNDVCYPFLFKKWAIKIFWGHFLNGNL